jgi:hypothetical protein
MDVELFHLICWLFAYLGACGLVGFGIGQSRGSPLLGVYYGLWFGLASEVLVPVALVAFG